MKVKKSNKNLVWIDLEMTGLNHKEERIIEIATIVTDSNLNILDEGPNIAIKQDKKFLDGMDEWNTTQHTSSGLLDSVLQSVVSTREAEIETLEFISKYVGRGKSPMCGNTVSHDRRFLIEYMPELEAYFHYRHIDVSSVKELVVRWMNQAQSFSKSSNHRALDDIKDSINELKHYKNLIFKE